ncbi:MAG: hypothetical protein AB7J13_11030 [Pyrinomonadaceae bacterium]
MRSILFTSAFLLALSAVTAAQMPGNPENWCRGGFFTRESENFGVGYVKGKAGSRAYFYSDDKEACPDGASCRSSSYLVPGNTVITNRTRAGYVCAWYAPRTGSPRVGWLREADLEFPLMLTSADEKVWTGEWRYAENTITFTPNKLKGFLNVTGNAIWKGLGDNVHIGELDGRAEHKNGVLKYADGTDKFDCQATMRLAIETYLIVADNGNCGGANVSFSGIYRKKRK